MRLLTKYSTIVALLCGLAAVDVWYFWGSARGTIAAVFELESRDMAGRPVRLIRVNESDCGAACLLMACRLFGVATSLPDTRELTKTTKNGTKMLELKRAAESLAFETEGLRLNWDNLVRRIQDVSTCAVLHVSSDHFLLATEGSGRLLRIVDPARGARWVSREELTSSPYDWKEHTLILRFDGDTH